MLKQEDVDAIAAITRTLQIIIVSMVTCLLVFLTIILVAVAPPKVEPGSPLLPVLSVFAIVVAATAVPVSLVLPGIVTAASRKAIADGTWAAPNVPDPKAVTDAVKLAATYQTRTIIAAALTEGPAFFALIAYMLERTPYALGLAIILMIGVAMRFPFVAAVQQWVDDQLAAVEMERH